MDARERGSCDGCVADEELGAVFAVFANSLDERRSVRGLAGMFGWGVASRGMLDAEKVGKEDDEKLGLYHTLSAWSKSLAVTTGEFWSILNPRREYKVSVELEALKTRFQR